MEKHTVSKLLGAPPGRLASWDGGEIWKASGVRGLRSACGGGRGGAGGVGLGGLGGLVLFLGGGPPPQEMGGFSSLFPLKPKRLPLN